MSPVTENENSFEKLSPEMPMLTQISVNAQEPTVSPYKQMKFNSESIEKTQLR
jgi:hypothetical protein